MDYHIWLIEAKVLPNPKWLPVSTLGMYPSREMAREAARKAANENMYNNPRKIVYYRAKRYVPCTK